MKTELRKSECKIKCRIIYHKYLCTFTSKALFHPSWEGTKVTLSLMKIVINSILEAVNSWRFCSIYILLTLGTLSCRLLHGLMTGGASAASCKLSHDPVCCSKVGDTFRRLAGNVCYEKPVRDSIIFCMKCLVILFSIKILMKPPMFSHGKTWLIISGWNTEKWRDRWIFSATDTLL